MYVVKFGNKYLTAENSFGEKNRALIMTNVKALRWIIDYAEIFVDYDMKVVRVS